MSSKETKKTHSSSTPGVVALPLVVVVVVALVVVTLEVERIGSR